MNYNNNDDNRIRRKKVSSNDYNYKYKQHQRYYKEKVRIDNTSYERKIENNKILTEAEIKDLSTINIGQNIYSINKKDIINSIKNNSYVENVKIKRKLPNAIEIQIEERTPKYQLKSDSQYIYIDEQGYILEVNSDAKDLTTIVGYRDAFQYHRTSI